jgi:hypothetical protein
MSGRFSTRLLGILHGGAAFALVWFVWTFRYPAMVDFPQHAALIHSAWDLLFGPGHSESYQSLHPFAPGALFYLLGASIHIFCGAVTTAKILLTAALLLYPLSVIRLCRQVGADPFLSFLVYPLLFGWVFEWGLLPFLFAVPISVFFIERCLSYAKSPSIQKAIGVGFLGVLCFFLHLLVFVIVLPIGYLSTLRVKAPVKQHCWQIGLFMLVLVIPAACWFCNNTEVVRESSEVTWDISTERLLTFAASVGSGDPHSTRDAANVLCAALLFWCVLRPLFSASLRNYLPLFFVLVVAAFSPMQMQEMILLFRFALYLIPILVLISLGELPAFRKWIFTILCSVFAGMSFFSQSERVELFNTEMIGLTEIVDQIPDSASSLGLIWANHLPDDYLPIFLHVPAYIQAVHSGQNAYSFAQLSPQFVELKPGILQNPTHRFLLHWSPNEFDPNEDGDFSYYLVRRPRMRSSILPWFEMVMEDKLDKVFEKDLWSLYKRKDAGAE